MKLLTVCVVVFAVTSVYGQSNSYQNLLDTAINGQVSLFVYSQPLKITRLDRNDMRDYAENLTDRSHRNLDTTILLQIIQNARLADTTPWSDKELPKLLLVNNRSETVQKKYWMSKFTSTDKAQIKSYKKRIDKFNATEAIDRNLYYFSRPVFDNSNKFAIVQWDNGHSYLGGGGGIILYELKDENWTEVGVIMSWRY